MKPFTKENLEKRIWDLENSYLMEDESDFKQILENQKIVEEIKEYVDDVSVWNSDNVKYRNAIVKILSTNKDAQEVEE